MGVLFVHKDVLNNGLSELDNADSVLVLKAYKANDSYASVTVVENVVAKDTITKGDKSISDHGTNDRKWQCNGKSSIAALINSSVSDDLHIAYIDDENDKVLFVTDEISNQAITKGNKVNVPAGEYRSLQPTAI